MAYNALIDRQLSKAFILAKDLKVSVQLTCKGAPSYDFGNGEPVSTDTVSTIFMLPISGAKASENGNEKKEVLVKTKETNAVKVQDTITEGTTIWAVVGIPSKGKHMTTLALERKK